MRKMLPSCPASSASVVLAKKLSGNPAARATSRAKSAPPAVMAGAGVSSIACAGRDGSTYGGGGGGAGAPSATAPTPGPGGGGGAGGGWVGGFGGGARAPGP